MQRSTATEVLPVLAMPASNGSWPLHGSDIGAAGSAGRLSRSPGVHCFLPKSAKARAIWPYFEEWVQPNLGKKDLTVENRIKEPWSCLETGEMDALPYSLLACVDCAA